MTSNLGDPIWNPAQPVRTVGPTTWQAQIQQLKTSGTGANPAVLLPNGPATRSAASLGVPQNVLITGISRTLLPNGQVRIAVSFTRNPADTNFQNAAIYLKQGSGQPSLVTQATTSPATFITPMSGLASAVILQSVGNFGPVPIANSPAMAVKLS